MERKNEIYTCFHGKCFRAAKAMVRAGLRWAPVICPVERMITITARPDEAAQPRRVSEPCVFWFKMAVAVPAKISMKVPMNSAPTCRFWHQDVNKNVRLSLTHENKHIMETWVSLILSL